MPSPKINKQIKLDKNDHPLLLSGECCQTFFSHALPATHTAHLPSLYKFKMA